jgi:membrane fusion protein, multidrug efflux system
MRRFSGLCGPQFAGAAALWMAGALNVLAQGPSLAPDATPPIRVLLAPATETTLVSQMAGRILEVNTSLGQGFEAGRVLVRLDCTEQEARLAMSAAEKASADQELEVKLRLQGLQQATEVEVALAASAVEKARAQTAVYQAQKAHCTIAAPFGGRTVKLLARPFQGVSAGQPVLELVSDGPLKLRLNVPGAWLKWVRRGTAFQVTIDETRRTYNARVTAINARIDPVSQTVELEGALASRAPDLLAGMSGNAQFTVPRQP